MTTPPASDRGGPLNLARACIEAHATDPASAARPALTFVDVSVVDAERVSTWTYAELWAEVQRIAHGLLALGLVPGDRVLIRLPHSPAYAFAFFGANLAGLVPIPASPQLTDEEARMLATDSDARGLIASEGASLAEFAGLVVTEAQLAMLVVPPGADALPETRAEDPAYLLYTSGTTARPKGVLHAQRVVRGRDLMRGDAWEAIGADDTTLHAGALNWSYTMGVGLMDPWAAGAHAVLVSGGVEPAAWPSILERHRVTVFAAVPTVYRQLLKYGRPEDFDLRALRHGLCAGEALTPAVAQEWTARTGKPLYESLGMTEVSTYVSSGPAVPVRLGSPGRAQPGRRIAVLREDDDEAGDTPLPPGEVGLLAVHRSDPGLMLGYWRRPEEEAAVFRGDWFCGGDRAAIDADGYLWFHGRADDVMKSFGYRLSPVEIEAALASCPGVAEVAVVGLAIDAERTLVTACIVPQPGELPSEATLRAHAAAHLAGYKQPHQYRVVESLPRTANGKVLRRVLIERLAAEPA
ncbi:MAG: AMP-dependent synthetase [Chloroflexi bacterium]|nr:MAG: AMP-dependent synthetase [Chloroflexota bacterium]